jgi:hypothetical protein
MSRSYKKPWYCDRSPWAKRQANKKVRKYKKGLSRGKSYKNLYSRYNICDYKFYSPDEPKAYRK